MDTPSASLAVYEGNLPISCWTHSLVAGVKHLFNGGPWHMSHIIVTMMSSCTVPTHPIQVLVSFGTGSQSSRGLWGTGCRHQWRQRDRTCGRIVSDWHWGCVKCPSPYNGKSLILPWNPPRIRCAFCGVDSALPNASDLRNLRSLCFWGEDRFFVIHVRAKEFFVRQNMKSAENWREIVICNPCRDGEILLFRMWICDKCHFQSRNRDIDTMFFVTSFHGLYLEIYDTKSWNSEIGHFMAWKREIHHIFPVNWVPLLSPKLFCKGVPTTIEFDQFGKCYWLIIS